MFNRPLSHVLVIVGAVAAMVLACSAAVFAGLMLVLTSPGAGQDVKAGQVATSAEGETWTLTELREFIESRGHKYDVYDGRDLEQYWEPAKAGLTEERRNNERAIIRNTGDRVCFYVTAVHVVQKTSTREAREAAGAKTAKPGEDVFSWGRFYFYGDKKMIADIRKALR